MEQKQQQKGESGLILIIVGLLPAVVNETADALLGAERRVHT